MRIEQIQVRAIGPFDEAVLEVPAPEPGQTGELVLFEGPNGSGKTTLAEVIACAAQLPAHHALTPAVFAPVDALTARSRTQRSWAQTWIGHEGQRLVVRDPAPWAKWPEQDPGNPAATKLILGQQGPAVGTISEPISWAAFAYRGHQDTPIVETRGPAEIETPPLRGALAFGRVDPASAQLGQLIVNLDQEAAKAFREAHREAVASDRRAELEGIAAVRQRTLEEIARVLSEVLNRQVAFEVPVGRHAPTIRFDGDEIPLPMLGEGMRSTLAWLADLLVRLHRVPWEDSKRSPLEQDFWLILDEIDESLHPLLQMRIVPALRRLFPNARMYITTHSPFVVASAGEGWVFSIRPDAAHRVSGAITPRKLEPGQSLEWVVEEVFGAESGIIDAKTKDALREHRDDITRLRRKAPFGEGDWRAFLARRRELMDLNEQVQTIVAMQEVPVAGAIASRIAKQPHGAAE